MAERARVIKMGVDSGVTDLDHIKRAYNAFAEGGYMDQSEESNNEVTPGRHRFDEGGELEEEWTPPEPITMKEALAGDDEGNSFMGALNVAKNVVTHSPRDMAYAIMAGPRYRNNGFNSTTSGQNREVPEIVYALNNIDDILATRGEQPRDLSSLYLYGNDKGQFVENEDLRYRGPDLSEQIRKGGRNPRDIKVYEGDFPYLEEEYSLPSMSREGIEEAIRRGTLGTYGAEAEGWEGDDVASFAQKIDFDKNGNPSLIGADYWDFSPKEYAKSYGDYSDEDGNDKSLLTKLEAMALDKVGMPFLLKAEQPIQFVDDDKFLDRWEENWDNLPDVVKGSLNDSGYLRPIVVKGINKSKKKERKLR